MTHPFRWSYWQWPETEWDRMEKVRRSSQVTFFACQTFLTASLLRSRWGLLSSSRSSWFSPFRFVVKNLESVPPAFLLLLLVRKRVCRNYWRSQIESNGLRLHADKLTSTFTLIWGIEREEKNSLCQSQEEACNRSISPSAEMGKQQSNILYDAKLFAFTHNNAHSEHIPNCENLCIFVRTVILIFLAKTHCMQA